MVTTSFSSSFSYCCDKMPDWRNLRKGFFWCIVWRHSPTWWGKCGSKSTCRWQWETACMSADMAVGDCAHLYRCGRGRLRTSLQTWQWRLLTSLQMRQWEIAHISADQEVEKGKCCTQLAFSVFSLYQSNTPALGTILPSEWLFPPQTGSKSLR